MVAVGGADVSDPLSSVRVSRNETMRIAADLEADVDVTVRPAAAPWEVVTANDEAHAARVGLVGSRSTPQQLTERLVV